MERNYKGLKEDGTWEDFSWDLPEEPTPASTGYEAIKAD